MKKWFLLILVGAVLPSAVVAAGDDLAYCNELGGLARRYASNGGGANGANVADLTIIGAQEDCRKGNTDRGIAALERKLRGAGVTLPKR